MDQRSAIPTASSTNTDNDDASEILAVYMERQRLEDSNDAQTANISKTTVDSTNLGQPAESPKLFGNEMNKKHEETSLKSEQEGHENENSASLAFQYATSSENAAREKIRWKLIERLHERCPEMSIVEPGKFASKYALSAPYHYFLNRVEKSEETHSQQFSLTFPEVLDRSLGELACSLQINFIVNVEWLIEQYVLAGQRTDMTILYGAPMDIKALPPTIKIIHIKMPEFACHHSKLMVLKYTDNALRVVVSTANLYSDDWENRTQGLWISPHLPRLPDPASPTDGESPTGFKKDFKRYLQKYNLPELAEWITAVRCADFSAVNVFFVASVPGSHKGIDQNAWGHRKVSSVLSKHIVMPPDAPKWPIIAQSSSIGNLGPNYGSWLTKEIMPSLCPEQNEGPKYHPPFLFIYPSIANYTSSFDMGAETCCLPYTTEQHQRQQWLEPYLFQWKAETTDRSRAMPHIKTYTRISPDLTEIPWFILTSANLSKAAWGNRRINHHIMNYEAGVIFIPRFVIRKLRFNIRTDIADGTPKFWIPYDLPLTKYTALDKPFVVEALNTEEQGNDVPPSVAFWYAASSTNAMREKIRSEVIERLRQSGSKTSLVKPGKFASKYALSAPYHYFLTRVKESKQTYGQKFSLTFPEVLDKSLGELACSLQINFMVNAGWLIEQYLLAAQPANMTILYGKRMDSERLPPTINMIHIKMPQFGCHHSKLMVLKYTNNAIRIVVSTANLFSDDWENRTQGVWISPHLPQLPDSSYPSDGESPTGFKRDLGSYLLRYSLPDLVEWIRAVQRADFSAVNVFFVASIPGSHKGIDEDAWGHRKLSSVLSQHVTMPMNASEWPIIAQSSNIGNLGSNYSDWLSKEIIPALCSAKNSVLHRCPSFNFIYPSIANYKSSFDMATGTSCLPYSIVTHQKQQWLEPYLRQWKSDRIHRSRAIPLIKTYTRISPDLTEIPWFVLTSANLSKAAWGNRRGHHYITSFEAGIIFIPKFVTGKSMFNICTRTDDGTPKFLIPYDLPLTKYTTHDKPFVSEFFQGYE